MRIYRHEKASLIGRILMLMGGGLCFAALILTVRESNILAQGDVILKRPQSGLTPSLDCTAINCPWDDAARSISNRIENIARGDIALPGFHPRHPPFEEFNPFREPPWIGG